MLTRDEFLKAIELKFAANGMDNYAAEAAEAVLDNFLTDENVDYGHDNYSWNEDAAIELAETEMSYW